jgi:hypothetical protein
VVNVADDVCVRLEDNVVALNWPLAWLRKRLADYILACASQGEVDPDKLAEKAIRTLNKPRRAA